MPRRSYVTLPWRARPEIVERCLRVYKLYYGEKKTYEEIMGIVGISFSTVYNDLCRSRQLADALAERSLESLRTEAVYSRRSLQAQALADRENAEGADASGRASLLRVATENQTGLEEVVGVRKKDAPATAKASLTVIQIGEKAPQALADMTPEERALVKRHLLEERAMG